MFCTLRASLFIFTLAVLATASPIKTSGRGIRIPLSDPPTVTKPDGTFDLEKAILMGIRTQNNYRQKLINLERNAGREAFNEGANILPLATVPASLQRRNSETLGEAADGWVTGKISIGTPAQTFTVGLDIGSSELWVTSDACTSPACSAETKYDASKSTTNPQQQSGTFKHAYGDIGSVSGPIYTDNVNLAGVEVIGQHFSSVTSMSGHFHRYQMDGMLGLGTPFQSPTSQNTFINTAFQQGEIHENAYSIMLSNSGSSLFLGGSDDRFFTGYIEYHNVGTGAWAWQLFGASVKVGDVEVLSNLRTIFDITSPFIYGPKLAVEHLYSMIPGFKPADQYGFYEIPCNSVVSFSFNWGRKDWVISNFILDKSHNHPGFCKGAIVAHDMGLGTSTWLLGSRFLMNMYTTFSFTRNAVGFSNLKIISP